MNTERNYAHEVVTDVMHNEVPNLATAQKARDQVEFLREQRDELAEALRFCLNALGPIEQDERSENRSGLATSACNAGRAALAKLP